MTHTLILHSRAPVTHDTYRLSFDRPKGFSFEPGQATELTLDEDGWREEGRPFTMVSPPDAEHVDFVIKSYPDHDGVTEKIPFLAPGDRVTAVDPFGAITDRGPGVFLAAGAGITPFIAILEKHDREGVTGDHLIFSNKTDRDIIMESTWDALPGVTPSYIVTDQADTMHRKGKLDQTMLQSLIGDLDKTFYICGPGGFVDAMRDGLTALGVSKDKLVIEDGW